MNRPWMPLYIADYRADTAHLGALEHGIYMLLIMHYWQTGGLPDDDAQLARIASATPTEWRRCKPTIAKFFAAGWKHGRIDDELAKAVSISGKRRGAAVEMHRKRAANAGARQHAEPGANHGEIASTNDANAMQMHTQSPSQSPSPPESDSDSQRVRDSFHEVVKAKREAPSPPRHGASTMKGGGRVYIRTGTPEWDAYAEDFRKARGTDPVANPHGGRWFKTVGEGAG